MEVKVICKTPVKALYFALFLSMISLAVKELGMVGVDWLLEGTSPFPEFSVCTMTGVVSAEKFTTYLELL